MMLLLRKSNPIALRALSGTILRSVDIGASAEIGVP